MYTVYSIHIPLSSPPPSCRILTRGRFNTICVLIVLFIVELERRVNNHEHLSSFHDGQAVEFESVSKEERKTELVQQSVYRGRIGRWNVATSHNWYGLAIINPFLLCGGMFFFPSLVTTCHLACRYRERGD